MTRLLLLALWLSTSLAPSVALGQGQRAHSAVLVVPRGEDVVVREIAARLRGELSAAGFTVAVAERDNLARPREEIERTAGESSATAVIVVRPEHAEVPSVDLWISDRVLGATSNLRLSSDEPDPSERARRLSVQAAEVLRARLAELLLASHSPARAPVQEAESPAPSPPVHAEERSPLTPHFELGAGPALTHGRALDATRWMPLIHAAVSWSRAKERAPHVSFALGMLAAGFGGEVKEHGERGAAHVKQGWGAAQAVLRLASWFPIEPELSLAVGVYGVAVQGKADPPYQAHRMRSFSPLVGAGPGLRARLLPRLSVRAASDFLYAPRAASIFVADERLARAGGLLFTFRLELAVVLW